MIVAIHQPNFLPWLGYFLKMVHADAFIHLDNVPFTKHGYQNRVRIKGMEGERWLTVPVLSKGRFGQLTCDVEIDNSRPWRDQHLKGLRADYGAAPFFSPIFDSLQDVYQKGDSHLSRFNLRLVGQVANWLGLRRRFFLASELGIQATGSHLLLRLVQAVRGGVYLSGPSGKDYLDLDLFARAGIEVRFHSFQHPTYQQHNGPFIEGLSVIDLLMNVGVEGARDVLAGVGSEAAGTEFRKGGG